MKTVIPTDAEVTFEIKTLDAKAGHFNPGTINLEREAAIKSAKLLCAFDGVRVRIVKHETIVEFWPGD